MLWARLHLLHTDDAALVYYTDYFRYEVYNVSIHNLHLFLWKNLDGLVSSLGYLILPNVTSSLFMKILAELIGVAMISGIVRMVKSGKAVHYAIFAGGTAFMLVIWHFPPNERFVLPLAPLAFAGLLTEMEHFVGMARAGLKHREASQRVAAAVMLGLVGSIFLGSRRPAGLRGRSVSGRDRECSTGSATSIIAAPMRGFARTCRRMPRCSPTTTPCCISIPGGVPSAVLCRRISGTPRIAIAPWRLYRDSGALCSRTRRRLRLLHNRGYASRHGRRG